MLAIKTKMKRKQKKRGFGETVACGCPDESGNFSKNRTRHKILSKCLNWTKPAPAGGVGWWSGLKLSSPSALPSHTPSVSMAVPSPHHLFSCTGVNPAWLNPTTPTSQPSSPQFAVQHRKLAGLVRVKCSIPSCHPNCCVHPLRWWWQCRRPRHHPLLWLRG